MVKVALQPSVTVVKVILRPSRTDWNGKTATVGDGGEGDTATVEDGGEGDTATCCGRTGKKKEEEEHALPLPSPRRLALVALRRSEFRRFVGGEVGSL